MDEVRSFKSATVAYADFLGSGGSAAVALMNRRPDVGFVILTVLPGERGRGLGTALYRTVSTWLSAKEITTIEAPVPEDDEESLAFALRARVPRGRARKAHDPRPCRPRAAACRCSGRDRDRDVGGTSGSHPWDLRSRLRSGARRSRRRERRDGALRGLARGRTCRAPATEPTPRSSLSPATRSWAMRSSA